MVLTLGIQGVLRILRVLSLGILRYFAVEPVEPYPCTPEDRLGEERRPLPIHLY